MYLPADLLFSLDSITNQYINSGVQRAIINLLLIIQKIKKFIV